MFIPTRATAQKDPFIEAFIKFHTLLSGTYGDEGPGVSTALDQMAVALSAWDTAIRKAEAELKSAPDSSPSTLALFYLDAGRPPDALAAIEAAIQIEPNRAGPHMFRGVVLDAMGRTAEAVHSLRTAWDLDRDDAVTAYLLADRLSTDPNSDDLQPYVATLLAAYQRSGASPRRSAPFIQVPLIDDRAADDPRFAPAAYAEGFALFGKGQYLDAIASFRAAVSRDPLVSDRTARSGQLAQGIATLRQGDPLQAIEQLESAVASSPSSSEGRRILGAAYGAQRNAAKSIEHLNAALQLVPDDERARVTLGRVLMEAGRMDEAERVLRATITALPASGHARWLLARLYERRRLSGDAIAQLEEATAFPVLAGKGALFWHLADLSHQVFDFERVVSALSRRTRLLPNDPTAHKSLGLAYRRTGRDDQALIELLAASLLGLEDAETMAVMGQIHLNAGRYPAAEDVLRRAVAAEPTSVTARYALGRTLLRLGKQDEGKQQLAESQRLLKARLDEQRKTIDLEVQQRKEDLAK